MSSLILQVYSNLQPPQSGGVLNRIGLRLIKGASDKAAIADMEAQKAEKQALLDKKSLTADKKKLLKEQAALQKEFGSLKVKSYNGIWKDAVTTADWPDKSGSIQAKKDYFQGKLNAGGLSDADKATFELFLKNLDEFEAEGKHYYVTDMQGWMRYLPNG
jgi:hypothetical protein